MAVDDQLLGTHMLFLRHHDATKIQYVELVPLVWQAVLQQCSPAAEC